nr:hypothetical protein [Actinomycetota bacterium]
MAPPDHTFRPSALQGTVTAMEHAAPGELSAAAAEDAVPALSGRSLATPDGGSVFVLEGRALGGPPRADVVILPAFGHPVDDLFLPSYYLRRNGFDVLRFDPRNHTGRGTGGIVNFRLSELERDLAHVLRTRPATGRPLLLLGVSMSAPVALKYAARTGDVAGVATLLGVVDAADTIQRATGAAIGPYRRSCPTAERYQEPLGHRVLAREFIADMDANGYGGFEHTCADACAVDGPVHLIAAGRDEYVDLRLVERLAGRLGAGTRLEVLERCSHRLARSIAAARRALALTAELCLQIAEGRA